MIKRQVRGRVGIVVAANIFSQILESIGREVLVPLEHHVLEKMGEPAPLLGIVFRANVIPDLHGHGWTGMIFD